MFVVILTYVRPLAEIDALMPAHVKFLKKHYASGKFLLSGRQNPRVGGIILASAESKIALQQIMDETLSAEPGLPDMRSSNLMPA